MSSGLNEAQLQAVQTRSGPMMVLAAAGTGKTRVITYRIANLIRHRIRPDRILALTFTNKAAREMRDRAIKLLDQSTDARPLIGTFHSVCVRILREDIEQLGFKRSFTIADRSDQEAIARRSLREERIDPKELPVGEFLYRVSRWKNEGFRSAELRRRPDAVDQGEKGTLAQRAYASYELSLRTANLLDFDDLLLATLELLRDHAEVLQKYQGRFDHVLVDEYQDTNGVQYQILKRIAQVHRNICVVGDDDQSIYGWRGAQIANLQRFESDFPGTKIVRLEENYRSCPNILRLANQLIRHNTGRYEKQLRSTRITTDEPRFQKFEDESQEAAAVVADLAATAAKEKIPFRDFAILFRTNEQPRLFEQELRSRDIPYILVGGYSFFDRREIRDVLAFLKVADNPSDEASLLRILNVPPRGLGPTVAERMVSRATEAGVPLWEILPTIARDNMQQTRVRAGAERIVKILEHAQQVLQGPQMAESLREMLENRIDYKAEIARQYDEASDQNARWQSVGELINMVAQYESRATTPSLRDFLDHVMLASEEDRKEEKDEAKNAVTLMTLHSAKGLEFRHVYLVGMEKGILPHERSLDSPDGIEEERRLAYVGVTRARDRLTLTRAMKRRRFGQMRPAEPSPFLPEMFGQPSPLAMDPDRRSDQPKTHSPTSVTKDPSPKSISSHETSGSD
ncbi:exodeoxyribonuclease V subunit gamma [bacterium]|nr:exodeoxyribonuclease V subunit gamma [bacterium]